MTTPTETKPQAPDPAAAALAALQKIAAAPVRERQQDVRDAKDEALGPLKRALHEGFAAFQAAEPLRAKFEAAKALTSMTPPGHKLDSPWTRLERTGADRNRLNEIRGTAERGVTALNGARNLDEAARRIERFGDDPRVVDLDAEAREIAWLINAVGGAPAEAEARAARLDEMLVELDATLRGRAAAGLPHRAVGIITPDDDGDAPQLVAETRFDPLGPPGRPA